MIDDDGPLTPPTVSGDEAGEGAGQVEDAPPSAAVPPVEDTPAPSRRSRARAGRHARMSEMRARREAARARVPRPQRDRAPRTKNARIRLAVAFAVLLVVIGAIAFGVWSTLYRAAADVPAGRTVTITVPKGSSGEQVATILAKAGIVTNATMFEIRAVMLGASSEMKPGTYEMTTGSGYDGVIRQLQAGPQIVYVTFTIPEGWGVAAIAARVQDKFGIPAATFVKLATTGAKRFNYSFLADNPTKSLEGYLFPKTYTLKASATATDVVNVMLAQFGKETASLDFSYARSKGIDEHQALTIASIIEREAVLDKDRPKVASVIYNRLAIGMRLQLDSTVQYALNGKANLTLADLKTASPYNTYVHTGVPPGPICNPGLVSIQAALHPSTTNYIYYILTGKDGSQSFTASYAKFLQLKAQTAKGLK
jgi:UPF0755 protein